MDRHTSTKLKLCCGEDVKNEKALVGQSTSAPVTSMDRHTSTKKQAAVKEPKTEPVKLTDRYTSVTKNKLWRKSQLLTKTWLIVVRVHLSRLWTDTQVRKRSCSKKPVTKPWLSSVRVHLSRLWTDTQVRKATVVKMSKLNLG